jgi:hypothetical protein
VVPYIGTCDKVRLNFGGIERTKRRLISTALSLTYERLEILKLEGGNELCGRRC